MSEFLQLLVAGVVGGMVGALMGGIVGGVIGAFGVPMYIMRRKDRHR